MLHIFLPLPYEEIKENGNLSNKAIPFLLPSLGRGLRGGVLAESGLGCVFFYINANISSMC